MDKENQKTLKYFDNLEQQINSVTQGTVEMGSYLKSNKIRLSNTDKGARTNARVDAALEERSFDESQTPIEELETVEEDIIEEMLNRELELIFGE